MRRDCDAIATRLRRDCDAITTRVVRLVGGYLLNRGNGVRAFQDRGDDCVHALPQAVRFADCRLPQAQSAVFRAAGVQLAVRREANAVHRAEMPLRRIWK